MSRLIKFVGRGSKRKTATLGDGRKVRLNEVVDVHPREARELLVNPGADDDSKAEWVPVAREEG